MLALISTFQRDERGALTPSLILNELRRRLQWTSVSYLPHAESKNNDVGNARCDIVECQNALIKIVQGFSTVLGGVCQMAIYNTGTLLK